MRAVKHDQTMLEECEIPKVNSKNKYAMASAAICFHACPSRGLHEQGVEDICQASHAIITNELETDKLDDAKAHADNQHKDA